MPGSAWSPTRRSEKVRAYDKGTSFTDDPARIHEVRVG
jgi:hypothetical protein